MKEYNVLDDFPEVNSFFGVDLRTGCFIIATLGIVHPIVYGCTCFLPMSYVMVSAWILLVFYSGAHIALFYGLTQGDASICGVWIWTILIITSALALLMVLLMLAYTSRRQHNRAFLAFLGILWYVLTVYFIFVVNTHRKQLSNKNSLELTSEESVSTPTTPHGSAHIQTTPQESVSPKKMIRVSAQDSPESATIFKMYLEIDPEKAKQSLNVLQNSRGRSMEIIANSVSISTTSSTPDEGDVAIEIKTTVWTTEQSTTSTECLSRNCDDVPAGDPGEPTDDFD